MTLFFSICYLIIAFCSGGIIAGHFAFKAGYSTAKRDYYRPPTDKQ